MKLKLSNGEINTLLACIATEIQAQTKELAVRTINELLLITLAKKIESIKSNEKAMDKFSNGYWPS